MLRIITDHEDIDPEEFDSEDEFMYQYSHQIETGRMEEIPAKEPSFTAVPLKSALKKKSSTQPSSNPGTPTQEQQLSCSGSVSHRPLGVRQENHGILK